MIKNGAMSDYWHQHQAWQLALAVHCPIIITQMETIIIIIIIIIMWVLYIIKHKHHYIVFFAGIMKHKIQITFISRPILFISHYQYGLSSKRAMMVREGDKDK